jgi:hypothetical protein
VCPLPKSCGKVGQLDEGLRALEEALVWVQNNEERLYETEVYWLKGELLLPRSGVDESARSLVRGVHVRRVKFHFPFLTICGM